MNQLDKIIEELLNEANKAVNYGDIPVAAALLNKDNEIVALSANTKEKNHNPLEHAEQNVIKILSNNLKNNYLNDYTLITTLEPCKMCFFSIIESRIKKVIYLAKDEKKGALNSSLAVNDKVNPKELPIFEFINIPQASKIIRDFFKKIR